MSIQLGRMSVLSMRGMVSLLSPDVVPCRHRKYPLGLRLGVNPLIFSTE